MTDRIQKLVEASRPFEALLAAVGKYEGGIALTVDGVAGSLAAVVVAGLSRATGQQILLVTQDADTADQMRDDLALCAGPEAVVRFGAGTLTDIQALRALSAGSPVLIVAHAAALLLGVPAPETVRSQSITLQQHDEIPFTKLRALLDAYGFERKEFVEGSGDYAVRGGILDVFPFAGENPLRLEFTGESLESIREFEPISQRSIRDLSIAVIVPNLLAAPPGDIRPPHTFRLHDFLASGALVLAQEPELVASSYDVAAAKLTDSSGTYADLEALLSLFPLLHLRSGSRDIASIDFGASSQPAFNSSVRHLRIAVADLQARQFSVILACDSPAEVARLKDLIKDIQPGQDDSSDESTDPPTNVAAIEFHNHAFHQGFIYPASLLAVLTEHQIFNRLKRRGRRLPPKFRGISDRELHQLQRGDYVVHADFGIGQFAGLNKIHIGSSEQEVVKVQYAEKDTLYVNLNYINRLQKYSSHEGHIPKLTRLGSPEWDRLKARTKERVKDIARSLISLYAKRKTSPGFAFSPDTPWQKELEASFLYEDTFDQAKATLEIKQDMESPLPMDRLVCGDVGFGKTEVAVRAAFKTVMDGKQVAVLVPTTILAMQHFNTFVDRTARYGVQVRVLSRFKPRNEQIQVLQELSGGTADIVIGTHRLLSKDVAVKNLGLLVIDEEHRFGVAAKEKLRQLRAEVDTLSLTATPIPRTLHFSLMGARDLSIIATPPRNRLPILTEITQWNDDLIRDAALRELQRGGQVYFVHDRIQNIDEVTDRLKKVLPGIRIAYAHGQMHAHELEEAMLSFLEKKIDILVSTKIIESGLDIPNVNTIIINRADRFGMAELYQLRGRVGRSNLQAYAYLLTPPFSILPAQTIKRLQALQEFNELGSGFNLAMRDLEIRGAGNLLGAEQSGFIESLGFETYTRILEEAVQELKAEEFQGLLKEDGRRGALSRDTIVEPSFDALIPDDYIGSDMERLAIYRRLYGLTTVAQLEELLGELQDRFGKFPPQVENLFGVVRLRLQATKAGFAKVKISDSMMEIEFPPESDRAFFESESFQEMMSRISGMKGRGAVLRQEGKVLKLLMSIARYAPAGKPLETGLEILQFLMAPGLPEESSHSSAEP
jgi:transcription-repair coupling factor (superfamily II helicase)